MSEQFFAEDGCDKFLAESGLLPDVGTWVDCGAAHPWRYSQTAFLRNRGWTGLAIDGDPAYAPEWEGIVNAKFVNAVLSDKDIENFLVEPTNSLVSRLHETGEQVRAYSLRRIMEAYEFPRCDFLAIDIEGKEAQVLHEFLLPRYWDACPKIIVAEFNSCHKGRDVALFNRIIKTAYHLVHMTDSNAVFALCSPRF